MLLLGDAQRVEQFTPAEVRARAIVSECRERFKNIETSYLSSVVAFNSPYRDECLALHAKPLLDGIEHRTIDQEQALAGRDALWRERRCEIAPDGFDKFRLLKIEGLNTWVPDNLCRRAIIKLRVDTGANRSRPKRSDEVPKFRIGTWPDPIGGLLSKGGAENADAP